MGHYKASQKTVKAYEYDTKKTTTIKISEKDLVVPSNQPKGKLVKVLLEPEAKLTDSITYDITAWSIPFAYGLKGFYTDYELEQNSNQTIKKVITNIPIKNAYA